jgi:endoglucanase
VPATRPATSRSRLTTVTAWCAVAVLAAGIVATRYVEPMEFLRPGPTARDQALAASRAFLDQYVDPDGRVVRHDEDGSTVSEGQAYGLLVAVAIGDEATFDRILAWQEEHLERDDGLLAWHWHDGSVDTEVAPDADLDAILALLVAAERFDEPAHRERAAEMARAIDEQLVVEVGDELVLLPGAWGQGPPVTWNPSYVFPTAFDALARTLPDTGRWEQLRASSYTQLSRVMEGEPGLPPDWAQIDEDGAIEPVGLDDPPRFAYDAVRVPIRLAVDCDERGRALAAGLRPFLASQQPLAAEYDLDGSARVDHGHPTMLVAAAAVEHAAGDERAAEELLDRAQELDEQHPSYYGAAWVALGRLLLTTDALQRCE